MSSNPNLFKVHAPFQPAGDQPQAIQSIVNSLNKGQRDILLRGVTGSGKTFTMAHAIANTQKTTLVLVPNKILAAQLYQEMKEFFPNNAVEYFVSYYDYYRPEAYLPTQNVYIAKESSINSQIDRMRHRATQAIIERKDTVIVSSISCIYGIGSKEEYKKLTLKLLLGDRISMKDITATLVALQYRNNSFTFDRGCFRVRGRHVDIFPPHLEDEAWRITLSGDTVASLSSLNPVSGETIKNRSFLNVFPNTHYAASTQALQAATKQMLIDLEKECDDFAREGKIQEAARLRERTLQDIEMLENTGSCDGVENYSRYFTQLPPGAPPPTLIDYLPESSLMIIDESHIAIPQIQAMYVGDQARKQSLVRYGFRLKAALDNRPLAFPEWCEKRPQTLFVSATPGEWETQKSPEVIQQIIRPTGLLDPVCIIQKSENQVQHLIKECRARQAKKERVLVTTLTKKMAEILTEFLIENNISARYMHSDVDTLERTIIIQDLRKGVFDVLVGINLLREGLDIPECSLVAILDADKSGYLRSKTALIQTIGRAARHINGTCILYADKRPRPLKEALEEVARLRTIQNEFNKKHNITPRSVSRPVHHSITAPERDPHAHIESMKKKELEQAKLEATEAMRTAAKKEDFKTAHALQKQLKRILAEIDRRAKNKSSS